MTQPEATGRTSGKDQPDRPWIELIALALEPTPKIAKRTHRIRLPTPELMRDASISRRLRVRDGENQRISRKVAKLAKERR
jgi:hypothetical protein